MAFPALHTTFRFYEFDYVLSWISSVVTGALKLIKYWYAYSHSFITSIYSAQPASRRSEKGNYE